MPRTNRPNNRRSIRRRSGGGRRITPPSNVQNYTGPYKLPGSSEQNTLYTMEMRYVIALTSDGSGVINHVFDNNPSGYLDWTSIANLWDEYRALSLFVEYKPNNRYSKTTVFTTPIYVLTDRDSTGVLTTKNDAVQYESTKIRSLDDPFSHGVKTKGTTGLSPYTWITTASASATYCIKTYSSNLTASTTYGDIIVTLLIELRGRN